MSVVLSNAGYGSFETVFLMLSHTTVSKTGRSSQAFIVRNTILHTREMIALMGSHVDKKFCKKWNFLAEANCKNILVKLHMFPVFLAVFYGFWSTLQK